MRTIESPSQSSPTGPGALLQLVRSGHATTRAELARYTGLARSTVAQRVEALLAADLLYEAGDSASTGGRPPTTLAFKHDSGVVLVADLGATHARLALSDLAGAPLAEYASELDIAEGPDRVLEWVGAKFEKLLDSAGQPAADVRGIGVGVPGPGEFSSGRPVSPPIMPGWDGFSLPDWIAPRHAGPGAVDHYVDITT